MDGRCFIFQKLTIFFQKVEGIQRDLCIYPVTEIGGIFKKQTILIAFMDKIISGNPKVVNNKKKLLN